MVKLKQERNRVCTCLEAIKTDLSARYQNPRDMGFF